MRYPCNACTPRELAPGADLSEPSNSSAFRISWPYTHTNKPEYFVPALFRYLVIDVGLVWEGYNESRRCSQDTYPQSFITKCTGSHCLSTMKLSYQMLSHKSTFACTKRKGEPEWEEAGNLSVVHDVDLVRRRVAEGGVPEPVLQVEPGLRFMVKVSGFWD